MNITLILPTATQPRFHKRINSLMKEHDCKVYAFDRGLYKKNAVSDVTILGEMKNKNYFKRISVYNILIKTILKNRRSTDLFYFFSIDFALIGYILLGKGRYVYEIGDFAYLHLPKFLVNFLSKIDSKIIKKSHRTIITSEGFRTHLKKINHNKELPNLLVIPNKPSREILNFERKQNYFEEDDKLRFGFVGILRYPNTVYRIVHAIANEFPNYEFVFYGDGGLKDEFIELCKSHENLKYKGQFKNPEDLGKIYSDFDIHIACYDITGLNQKIAEPNKLYESVYFGNPLIATKGSFFGETTEKNGFGYVIEDFSEENISNFLKNIKASHLNEFRRNMLQVKDEDLIDSDTNLLVALRTIKSR